jgi:hypothetical protein
LCSRLVQPAAPIAAASTIERKQVFIGASKTRFTGARGGADGSS